jgi:hypothetical protein
MTNVYMPFGKHQGKPITLLVRWYPGYALWSLTLPPSFWERYPAEHQAMRRAVGEHLLAEADATAVGLI